MVSEGYYGGIFERAANCLNPCFSGGWSRRPKEQSPHTLNKQVLILVLVEDGLGASNELARRRFFGVLILVLVEDGLGALLQYNECEVYSSLNPCFSGGWSRR